MKVRTKAAQQEDYTLSPGFAIRNLRDTLGLTQTEFALQVGVSSATVISLWESNRVYPNHVYRDRLKLLGIVSLPKRLTTDERKFRQRMTQ